MMVRERTHPEFFRRKWKTAAPGSLNPAAPTPAAQASFASDDTASGGPA
jgi:hypothetical protein